MKMRLMLLSFSLVAVSLTVKAADMPAGGFAGTWKVNFAKSKFPGKPPQVDMATIDPDGTVTINETNSEGKSTTWHYKPIEGQAVSVVGRDIFFLQAEDGIRDLTVTGVQDVCSSDLTRAWCRSAGAANNSRPTSGARSRSG